MTEDPTDPFEDLKIPTLSRELIEQLDEAYPRQYLPIPTAAEPEHVFLARQHRYAAIRELIDELIVWQDESNGQLTE
jgi:hypothetical protein